MRLDWISEQMKARGVTQKEVGEAIGLSEGKMSKVMNGHRKLSAAEADGIRRFFGYPLPDDLPPGAPERKVLDGLSVLDEHQKLALALYLEALAGDALRRLKAS